MGKAVSDMDRGPAGIIGEFEGSAVMAAGIEIRNAAGGLNESLRIEPAIYKKGDSFFVALRVDVIDVHFPSVKGNEDQCRRVHVTRATDAVIIDGDLVQGPIDKMRDRVVARQQAEERERERVAGTQRIVETDGKPTGETAKRARASKPIPIGRAK